jgi:hypothetical protein
MKVVWPKIQAGIIGRRVGGALILKPHFKILKTYRNRIGNKKRAFSACVPTLDYFTILKPRRFQIIGFIKRNGKVKTTPYYCYVKPSPKLFCWGFLSSIQTAFQSPSIGAQYIDFRRIGTPKCRLYHLILFEGITK